MRISLSRLSVTSLSALVDRVIRESKLEKHPVVKDDALLTALENLFEGYDAVFGKRKYSGVGKLVASADLRRNEAFVGMKFCVYGLTKVSGHSLYADATELYKLFKHIGLGLDQYNYSEKSALLSKLVERMDLPENAQLIEATHLTEIYGILKAAQINFEGMIYQQIAANSKLRQLKTASSLRRELEMALHNYLALVTAMKQLPGWKELYLIMNEFVKAARNSHRPRKDTPEEAPVTEVSTEEEPTENV